jgi:hypothetical protein
MTQVQDLGPLDWRIAIVDKTGRPTPEFQRKWQAQRDNNAQIGTISFGSGAPTGSPEDGAEYVDTSTTPYTLYVGNNGSWVQVGAIKFTDLLDAPHAYTGSAGLITRVNSGATGLEFDSISTILDSLGTAQGDILYRGSAGWVVLAAGTSGQFLETQGTGANPQWGTPSGGGGGGYTPPTGSTFSWLYQPSGATVAAISGGLYAQNPAAGSVSVAALTQVCPSTPYTFWAGTNKANTNFSNANGFGIILGDTSGNAVNFFIYWGNYNSYAVNIAYETLPNDSSRTSIPLNQGPYLIPSFIGVNDDGTNLNFLMSNDGGTAQPVAYSVSRTSFLSGGPHSVGVSIGAYNGQASAANVCHWAPTLPF